MARDPSTKRSEELRFKVTLDVKQRFRRSAKDLDLKKGEFLERMLAAWQDAQSGKDGDARSEDGPPVRPAPAGDAAGRGRRTKP